MKCKPAVALPLTPEFQNRRKSGGCILNQDGVKKDNVYV